jgi:KaiC/GvpD/RAD55 family RecA-like ATPase
VKIEYTDEVQTLFLNMMLTEHHLFTRVQNILNADNFTKRLRPAVKFLQEYSQKYNGIPDAETIRVTTNIELDKIHDLRDHDIEWFLDEFEKFTRKQELERAILKSAELLEKGNYDPVEKLVKDAVQISLTKDMGIDYYDDPRGRLMAIKAKNGQVTTGWPVLDRKLYGGFNRGELQLFLGGSGSGKSLFMQNLAVTWSAMGLNGVYVTLELSEELCSWRMDGMMTDIPTNDVWKQIDDVELKVKMIQKKAGQLRVKYMPAQSTVNDLRAYCKELQVQTDTKLDFICVDYLDLMMPVSAKVSPSDLFVKDKYVSEELRNLAKELNALFVTASQLNRSAVEESEFDHSHISGGISKINTADNVFGIFTSRNMREKGKYQLQLMKTRSSSGVGTKIDLSFNKETLKIFDDGEDGTTHEVHTGSSILSKIKTNSQVINRVEEEPEESKVVADVQSNKVKQMLAQFKKGS